MTVPVIIGSLSNEDGNGIENVTQKVNSRCFKLHRSYCNSFNLSNVCRPFNRIQKILLDLHVQIQLYINLHHPHVHEKTTQKSGLHDMKHLLHGSFEIIMVSSALVNL